MDTAPTWPILEVALEPKSQADAEKLVQALAEIEAADPSLSQMTDQESGQIILAGNSFVDLDRAVGALIDGGIGVNVGSPQVAYRETIGRRVEIDFTLKKQVGGTGQFARVRLVFEPGETNSGFRFESAVANDVLPREYVSAVLAGLEVARQNGLIAGFPLIDFAATLVDGAYHDIDSSVAAFETAARSAFRELREKGAPVLLEPIMKVEVRAPEEFVGDITGELRSRRGEILGVDRRGEVAIVAALVPLANMFEYGSTLRGMTEGRAEFVMQCDHYARVDLGTSPDPDLFPPAVGMRA